MSDITLAPPPMNPRTLKRVRVPAGRVHNILIHRVSDLFRLSHGGMADVVIVTKNGQPLGYIVPVKLAEKVVKLSELTLTRKQSGGMPLHGFRIGSLFTRVKSLDECQKRIMIPGQPYCIFWFSQPSTYDLRMLDPNLPPLQRAMIILSPTEAALLYGNVSSPMLEATAKLFLAMGRMANVMDEWHWGESTEGTDRLRRAAERILGTGQGEQASA